ncbi:hypothetical protein J4482_03860, partial [Candidatus Woesearchaeota archaeon]|nr:hypothetical protein [Candidatus Woesearchaeota archaeon]
MWLNKSGYIKLGKNVLWVVLALSMLSILMSLPQVSAAKADQYIYRNYTCEAFTDSVAWTAVTAKNAVTVKSFNWSIGTACPGVKNCDIRSIETNARYVNIVAGTTSALGGGYTNISNRTGGSRFAGYLNQTIVADTNEVYGPVYGCGDATTPNTCSTLGAGYGVRPWNYSVKLRAGIGAGGNKWRLIVDDFNVRYPWCWTPIIQNVNVTPQGGDYNTEFTFKVNVTNPGATTNVYLWTRTTSGTWEQEGSPQACVNCIKESLSFPVTFAEADIGNKEFKFNATDGVNIMQAGNPSTLGTITNECLDSEKDCIFTITAVSTATGAPILTDEKVNGVTSGATEGWGTNWTFSVYVNRSHGGAGDINLTLEVNTGEGLKQMGRQICTAPCNNPKQLNFSVSNFTCNDISAAADGAEYKFTATNLNGTTTTTQTYTIEKDDITIQYARGNNSISNRSGDQITPLSLRLFDTDKFPSGAYISNGTNVTYSVKFNAATYESKIRKTDVSGYANYSFNATCTPNKYLVGDRAWKGETESTVKCYKATSSPILNLTIRGDINLTINTPDGSQNYTQEGTPIIFLGSSVDDCGDALVTTVKYNATSGGNTISCNNPSQIGANAFQCIYTTTLSNIRGWYNVTMFGNKALHYYNSTKNIGDPGLFYLFPKKKLLNPVAIPTSGGWGKPNWNFSVNASSGDLDKALEVNLFLAKTVNPTVNCRDLSPNC